MAELVFWINQTDTLKCARKDEDVYEAYINYCDKYKIKKETKNMPSRHLQEFIPSARQIRLGQHGHVCVGIKLLDKSLLPGKQDIGGTIRQNMDEVAIDNPSEPKLSKGFCKKMGW